MNLWDSSPEACGYCFDSLIRQRHHRQHDGCPGTERDVPRRERIRKPRSRNMRTDTVVRLRHVAVPTERLESIRPAGLSELLIEGRPADVRTEQCPPMGIPIAVNVVKRQECGIVLMAALAGCAITRQRRRLQLAPIGEAPRPVIIGVGSPPYSVKGATVFLGFVARLPSPLQENRSTQLTRLVPCQRVSFAAASTQTSCETCDVSSLHLFRSAGGLGFDAWRADQPGGAPRALCTTGAYSRRLQCRVSICGRHNHIIHRGTRWHLTRFPSMRVGALPCSPIPPLGLKTQGFLGEFR